MDRDRLRRIRNYQSTDWYPAIFMRPLCILVMLVVADWKFLTPNLLTHLGNICKVAAAALIFVDDVTYTIVGVALLQAGLLFDHLDGTMARYRRSWSSFGSFYDKVSDAVTWFAIVMSVGWVAYRNSGDAMMIVLAATSAYSLLAIGYMKWVAAAEVKRADWYRALNDADDMVEANTKPPKLSVPPERSASDWVKWFAKSMVQVVRFEETDLFFWVGLALLIGQVEILLWVMAATQTFGVFLMLFIRSREVIAADRVIAPLRRD
jgi:phosphatidylglycerophosphate synthase